MDDRAVSFLKGNKKMLWWRHFIDCLPQWSLGTACALSRAAPPPEDTRGSWSSRSELPLCSVSIAWPTSDFVRRVCKNIPSIYRVAISCYWNNVWFNCDVTSFWVLLTFSVYWRHTRCGPFDSLCLSSFRMNSGGQQSLGSKENIFIKIQIFGRFFAFWKG